MTSTRVAALAIALISMQFTAVAHAQDEPKGVRVKCFTNCSSATNPTLVEWGATAKQLEAQFPPPPPPAITVGVCPLHAYLPKRDEGLESCALPFGWTTDLGGVSIGAYEPSLTLYNGHFFQYTEQFNAGDELFGLLADIFDKSLGKATSADEIPMQNGYGAKWTARTKTWKTPHLTVRISEKVSTIDKGLLIITYEPLAPPVKAPTEGKAPF